MNENRRRATALPLLLAHSNSSIRSRCGAALAAMRVFYIFLCKITCNRRGLACVERKKCQKFGFGVLHASFIGRPFFAHMSVPLGDIISAQTAVVIGLPLFDRSARRWH